jgi:antitoxin HicB
VKVAYPVRIRKEQGVYTVQGLKPLDNVLTYGKSIEKALGNTREALTGVLGAMLDHGQKIPPPPKTKSAKGVYWVEPAPSVAIPILVRRAREEAGLTLVELAEKLQVTYQAVQKWERSGTNPTVATLERVLQALGKKLELEVA